MVGEIAVGYTLLIDLSILPLMAIWRLEICVLWRGEEDDDLGG